MSDIVSNQAARVRISQRQPQACRECTKRKRKCDKKNPCTRCIRLELKCSIEIVQLRRNAVQHGSEIQFLRSLLVDLESSLSETVSLVEKIKIRIFRLETGQDPPESDVANNAPAAQELSTTEDRAPRQWSFGANDNTSNQIETSLLTAIEHLAWGRNSAGCFPHRTCSCQYRKDGLQSLSAIGPLPVNVPSQKLNTSFPGTLDAQKLIKFHCEVFWETGKFDDPLWLALYLSVLSATVSSIQDSTKLRGVVDVDLHAIPSTQQLFSAMVQTLYNSHFLSNLSVYSVQAIVISTEVAHNLGLSQLNATLFNAAVRIAECLGIHKIQDQPNKLARNKDEWDEKVEREVGKRVWCQMIIQDHFAIPFTDTYSISPMHFSTGPPMNADDYDLTDVPITSPTISTYIRVLVKLAELMPGLVDGLGPMKSRKPMREQYEHILKIDQKMRGVVKNIPPFLLRADKTKDAEIPWLAIARRSLAITAAEKIIMIHRPFLFRSFNDQTYVYSRRTCVAAAMTILREHEVIVREGDVSIWTHTAFAITAAVIMCFEVNATAENQATIAQSHKDAIVAARTRLADRTNDVLAQRGVALIDAIFTADIASDSKGRGTKMIDFGQILAKFSTFTRINLTPDTPDASPIRFSNADPHDVISAHFKEMHPAWDTAEDTDFDAWFNGTFCTLHDPFQFERSKHS
ncbi:Fungal transcriptional regulatory protein, N-terminal [Penicillium digitatum]|uniref:Fungal transcriptional regulatory protein, N-terminal n=1 Tax=Penicillium digitatum TaxID=36651 RepID=A0A7T6XN21_PENDI|nr:Fungal transcriptional regulatory protein, N-terminal [Penicillium digitatum]